MPENLAVFLLVCYLADLIAGDPRTWPHPVRLFGRILDRIEPAIRRSGLNLKACGFGVLLAGLFLTLWVTTLLTSVPLLGVIISLYLGYASLALGCLIKVSLTTIAGDARTMDSPNAGWTMATAAHLLGVSMGGPSSYFGEKRLKPVLGRGDCRYTSAVINNLIRLILISSILYASALIVLALLVSM